MENSDREYQISDVSIIIPCRTRDEYVKRAVVECARLYPEAEILVIDDKELGGFPAGKRNLAMQKAKGSVYAFLDSDAYPRFGWLETALYYLKFYPAVCGAGVLPYDAPTRERIADIVYQMLPYSERVTQQTARVVTEYPTFNLIVRKEVATPFENYLTGEDSLFCRKIKEGIYYHPDIMVYHNRRGAYYPLWRQVGTFGRHRGYLIHAALIAWVTTVFSYGINFLKGFFWRKL